MKNPILNSKYWLPALLFWAAACQPDRAELVENQVAARVAKYRAERDFEARQKLLDEASHLVDSMLLDEARRNLLDSLNHLRPFKPFKPPRIPALDSGAVKPLF